MAFDLANLAIIRPTFTVGTACQMTPYFNVSNTTDREYFCHTNYVIMVHFYRFIINKTLQILLKRKQTVSNQNGGIKKSCANMGQDMCDYHCENEPRKANYRH